MGTPYARATASSTASRWLHDPRPRRSTSDTGRSSWTEYTGPTAPEIQAWARCRDSICRAGSAGPAASAGPAPSSRTSAAIRGLRQSRIRVGAVLPSAAAPPDAPVAPVRIRPRGLSSELVMDGVLSWGPPRVVSAQGLDAS
ncbi:hypothetical protein ADK97_20530 [Streptomyces sp. H021]|nr:hypothetical protein ADK97_20530 [Streptomyces sp. H021]